MEGEVPYRTFILYAIQNKVCRLLLFFIFITFQCVYAQGQPAPEYQVKAAFIFNFTRFIDWPPQAFSSRDAPFVIGIIGKDPFGAYMEGIVAGEKVGNHPIVVQHYRDVKDIGNCHILFINKSETIRIKKVISALNRRNILTVSDADNFARYGGIVHFFTMENKIRLQINVASAKAAQLTISSKLLAVASIF